jgi:hypothetical protein
MRKAGDGNAFVKEAGMRCVDMASHWLEMPPQKCSVAIYTRSGRSTDYKVLVCRREVAVIE